MASVSIEEPLCNFLSAFDGTKKEFRDVRPHFDDLFSDDLIYMMDDRPINKTALMCIIKHILEERIVATLEDIYFPDDTHVEYTVHWGNEHTSMVSHVIALVSDGKILKVEPCEETKGVFANLNNTFKRNRFDNFQLLKGWIGRS